MQGTPKDNSNLRVRCAAQLLSHFLTLICLYTTGAQVDVSVGFTFVLCLDLYRYLGCRMAVR